ncbi:response regulator transcription factor [Desulforhabdus amnigena]|uniref:DNA-binding response regulator n=1 Tax=Desulforhabdus amnigena TaxID=40218 RepID=A0A9W6L809_9BACT|nr:response regulator transcription factor [Desulforhabdus amnigena]NLJ27232.1 response regulator transcription factor [Deltaproteobacteria bacterium]GLI35203.1 DNA-binding response regulator [Desulforhabdus amnigena]
MVSIRVVLADDHPYILRGLEDILRMEGDFEVLASCTNGEEACEAVQKHIPDILVLDIRMPGKDGMTVLKEIHDLCIPVKVVFLTAEISEEEVLESFRLGLKAIVLKEMAPKLLVQCLRKVYAGEVWIERHSFSKAMDKLLHCKERAKEVQDLLTDREIEVVKMIAQGARNTEIAERLFISESTVKRHLYNIFKKLNIESRTQLALYAKDKCLK